MKYFITILFSLTIYLCSWNSLYAQSEGGSILINSDVISDLDMEGVQNLSFGTIIENSKKNVSPVDNSSDASGGNVNGVTGTENRGYFVVDGTAGSNVNFEVSFKERLFTQDGQDNLLFTLEPNGILQLIITETEPTGTDAVSPITNGDGLNGDFTCQEGSSLFSRTCSSNNSIALPDAGAIVYVAVGGEVSSRETQTVGTYSEDITLTATIVN